VTDSLRRGSWMRHAGSQRVALIVAVAWFMQNLDTSIINTSLPQMARTLGVTTVSVNIAITAYIVAGAAFIPLGGWMADRYGARPVLAAAIVVFGVASVGCAGCTTLWELVLARVIQGIGGALMTPVGRIVVLRNTSTSQLLRAMSLITWPGLMAPVIAPVIGGALTTWFGWQWNFLLNAPIAVVGAALVLAYIPDHREPDPKPLDRTGSVLIAVALTLTIYGLSQLAGSTSPGADLAILAAGGALTAASAWWFRHCDHPLIDLRPLRIPTFAAATLYAGNLIRLAISATPFLLPLMLEVAWHLTPLDAGKIVLVYSIGNLTMKTITTPLLRAFGFRPVLVGNGIAVAASIGACGLLNAGASIVLVDTVVFIAGATRSIEFTGINTLTFADIGPHDRTPASTFFSMMQQVSMALGVAVAAIALHVAHGAASSDLTQADFSVAFELTAAVALVGALLMLRLRPDAGQAVTGHPPRRQKPRAESSGGAHVAAPARTKPRLIRCDVDCLSLK
jgi:EmrB/QacA subfamily drug resistance transporter